MQFDMHITSGSDRLVNQTHMLQSADKTAWASGICPGKTDGLVVGADIWQRVGLNEKKTVCPVCGKYTFVLVLIGPPWLAQAHTGCACCAQLECKRPAVIHVHTQLECLLSCGCVFLQVMTVLAML